MKNHFLLLILVTLLLTGCNQSPLTQQIIPTITPTPSPRAFTQPTVAPTAPLQLPDNINLDDLNLDLSQPENYDLETDPINLQNTQNLGTLNVTLTP